MRLPNPSILALAFLGIPLQGSVTPTAVPKGAAFTGIAHQRPSFIQRECLPQKVTPYPQEAFNERSCGLAAHLMCMCERIGNSSAWRKGIGERKAVGLSSWVPRVVMRSARRKRAWSRQTHDSLSSNRIGQCLRGGAPREVGKREGRKQEQQGTHPSSGHVGQSLEGEVPQKGLPSVKGKRGGRKKAQMPPLIDQVKGPMDEETAQEGVRSGAGRRGVRKKAQAQSSPEEDKGHVPRPGLRSGTGNRQGLRKKPHRSPSPDDMMDDTPASKEKEEVHVPHVLADLSSPSNSPPPEDGDSAPPNTAEAVRKAIAKAKLPSVPRQPPKIVDR